MTQVWAVSNHKGGVGKTTTVANLAGLLASQGASVLMVDLDPHGSLTSYFDLAEARGGVYELFLDVIAHRSIAPERCIHATTVAGLDLLPAMMALATIERRAGSVEGLGLVLQQGLKHLGDHYDHVLIDSPPMLGVLMVNALAACERLLIPLSADFLALRGLERMLHTLEMIGHSRQQTLDYLIVPTLYDRRPRVSVDTLRVLRDRYGPRLWAGTIPMDTKVREASQAHLPLCRYCPRSRAAVAYGDLLECLGRQAEDLPGRRSA